MIYSSTRKNPLLGTLLARGYPIVLGGSAVARGLRMLFGY
jgi:hypothetical protein